MFERCLSKITTPVIVLVLALSLMHPVATFASPITVEPPYEQLYARRQNPAPAQVKIYLRNNKGWFRAINLAIVLPGDSRPRIESKTLFPWARFALVLPEGSKIYLINSSQLANVKAGADLSSIPPSLVVQASDQGEVYPLFP